MWPILALVITTAFVPAQKALGNPEALWEAVERSDEAGVKTLLSQGADPNSKNTSRPDNPYVPQLIMGI